MITVYSMPHCASCNKLKKYLLDKKINYKEVDISTNNFAARYLIEKTGVRIVPDLEIDESILVGFNKKDVECAINAYFMINKNKMTVWLYE